MQKAARAIPPCERTAGPFSMKEALKHSPEVKESKGNKKELKETVY
jgi:hypothetical protein